MKKTTRTLLLVLALVVVLSIGVFATWNQFQGNDNHNGQITDTTPPPISPSPTVTTAPLNYNGGGWSGVDTTPVMETINGVTYSYVTYNGRYEGTQLSKINCNDCTSEWDVQLATGSANVLATPYLDTTNGIIYVAAVDYYYALSDPEFILENNDSPWSRTGNSSIHVEYDPDDFSPIEDESYVTIPSGGTIYQSFTYPLNTSTQTQLTSAIKLSSGSSATVTYTLTKPDNSTVTLDTKTVTSKTNWTYVNALGSGHVSATGTYKITVSVTGGTVIIDYVNYSRTAPGIKAVNRAGTITNANVAYASYGGQINTPITKYGNYLYFGTYNGQYKYYQVDLTESDPTKNTKVFTGSSHFYWAGAYSDGTSVAFGGDGGYLYYTTVADFGTTTKTYSLNTLGGITAAGNVRSSLCKNGDYIYFTSQGGSGTSYIWKVYWPHIGSLDNPVTGDVSVIQLSGGSATSTPAISSNGYIYVGTYGSATYSNNGVRAIPVSNFSSNAVININSGSGSGKTGTNRAVQSSVIVYSTSTEDYVYFTTNQYTSTNAETGRGFCYKHTISSHTCSKVWDSGEGNFTLQGMAACNGYLTFGNDANTFYVIHAS